MRKRKVLSMSLSRAQKKLRGDIGPIPTTAEGIKDSLPMKYQTTATNGGFLRYMEYTDGDAKSKLMMVYLSDNGKYILENSEEIYADGTFDTAPGTY